ncbi:MAG: VOC family protein [Clostridiales bacterium]
MKFANVLLVVENIEKSTDFYNEVLGLEKILDFGANVTLSGGISLQTQDSWLNFIGADVKNIKFGGNDGELYFEEEDFDSFIEKLKNIANINYVHGVMEHSWGQRVVRFYDLDKHIIEVGENIAVVCRRFLGEGLSVEKTAKRMDVPISYVESFIGAD